MLKPEASIEYGSNTAHKIHSTLRLIHQHNSCISISSAKYLTHKQVSLSLALSAQFLPVIGDFAQASTSRTLPKCKVKILHLLQILRYHLTY